MTHQEFAKKLAGVIRNSFDRTEEYCSDVVVEAHIAALKSILFLSIYGYLMHVDAVSNYGEDDYVDLRKLCDEVTIVEDTVRLDSAILSILLKFEEDDSGTSNYAYDPARLPVLT